MGFGPDGYYTFRDMLGYGAKWNILLSPQRGIGKTYGYKRKIMAAEGEQAMVVYRQKPDMEHARSHWLDDLTLKGPKEKRYAADRFSWQGTSEGGYELLMDDEVKVYFRTMTSVNAIKNETFPETLSWMYVDEFIPLAWKKLPGIQSEGETIETIADTIDHDTVHPRTERGFKPLRVILIANPFTFDNPILSYFGVNGLLGPGIWKSTKHRSVVWEYLPEGKGKENAISNVANRSAAKMAGTAAFVEPAPKGSVPVFSVRIVDKYFLFREYGYTGLHYVSETDGHQVPAGRRKRYGTLEGLQEEETAVEVVQMLDRILNEASRGLLRYADVNCKFDLLTRLM